jgi:threonine dehydratase
MTDLPFSLTSAKRSSIHESIVDTIGNTPIVKLQRMSPKKGVDIYVKCESENPGGSVKDRLALGVIEWAATNGQIKPGQVRTARDYFKLALMKNFGLFQSKVL